MAEDDTSEGVIVTWSAIWVTLLVAFAQSAVFYLFFQYQRAQEQKKESFSLYEPRQHTRRHRSPAPFAASWWKDAWNVSQEELLQCVEKSSKASWHFPLVHMFLYGKPAVLSPMKVINNPHTNCKKAFIYYMHSST
jgi:hypothetical protein